MERRRKRDRDRYTKTQIDARSPEHLTYHELAVTHYRCFLPARASAQRRDRRRSTSYGCAHRLPLLHGRHGTGNTPFTQPSTLKGPEAQRATQHTHIFLRISGPGPRRRLLPLYGGQEAGALRGCGSDLCLVTRLLAEDGLFSSVSGSQGSFPAEMSLPPGAVDFFCRVLFSFCFLCFGFYFVSGPSVPSMTARKR